MNIVVFSDAHVKNFSGSFSEAFLNSCSDAEMVIGLGDYVCEDFYFYVKAISRSFHFVQGNCDDYPLKRVLPVSEDIILGGMNIHLTHGWGSRENLEKRILGTLNPDTDLVLFGHKHEYVDRIYSGVRFINPGPCIPGGSFILLKIDTDGSIAVKKTGV